MKDPYVCCGCDIPMGSQSCFTCVNCNDTQTPKTRMYTNGGRLRSALSDHELAILLAEAVRSGIAGGAKDTYHQWMNWLGEEVNSNG